MHQGFKYSKQYGGSVVVRNVDNFRKNIRQFAMKTGNLPYTALQQNQLNSRNIRSNNQTEMREAQQPL